MLRELTAVNFRNIERIDLSPGQGLNFIVGANGAGKSSLLEAVDFLSRGRTFRTRLSRALVREGSGSLTVSAGLEDGRRLGARRRTALSAAQTELRINGQAASSQAEMAAALPVVIFYAGNASQARSETSRWRGVLDWGVFHMEPAFHEAWKVYRRALRQRNTLLQASPPGPALAEWSQQMIVHAKTLDACRGKYAEQLISAVETAAEAQGKPLRARYFRGWPADCDFEQALAEDEPGDRRAGYTRRGPHRATLRLTWEGAPASERASRGQQKDIAATFMLAQVELFSRAGARCVVMVDDLTAEFDEAHSRGLLEALGRTGQQVLVTATERAPCMGDYADAKTFYIERGGLKD